MITYWFLKIVSTVLTGALSLVPAWSIPASLTSFTSTMGDVVSTINGVFPIVTVIEAVGVVLAFRLALWVWDFVVWIYDKIPLKAT